MHRHTADSRASTKFLHPSTRSLRRQASLLSTYPPLAGVAADRSRSIKPRERDLGDLRLFFLVRILTRPTNHPRHAACASNYESKPVRPLTTRIIQQIAGFSRVRCCRNRAHARAPARMARETRAKEREREHEHDYELRPCDAQRLGPAREGTVDLAGAERSQHHRISLAQLRGLQCAAWHPTLRPCAKSLYDENGET